MINSLVKGLDVLSCFDFDSQTISAPVISKRLNIPLSTTYRYLETLTAKGFLVRNGETTNYHLGLVLFKLGNIVFSQMTTAGIILPHMKAVAALSRETVLLTAMKGFEVVCIERIEADHRVKLSLERGSSLPSHAGASSKVVLAYQEDAFVTSMLKKKTLARFTHSTITTATALKRELRKIREQGFAFSDEEVDPGAVAISAPVLDHCAKVVAGLSVAGPRERMIAKKEEIIKIVKEHAYRASLEFGYSGKK
jgi:IclR family transcriptional regulator, KDG regulon repressor